MAIICSSAETTFCNDDFLIDEINPISTANLWSDKFAMATAKKDEASQNFLAQVLLQWRNTVHNLPKNATEIDHLRAILRSLRAEDEAAYHFCRKVIFGASRAINFNHGI